MTKKTIAAIMMCTMIFVACFAFGGCEASDSRMDTISTIQTANTLQGNQPTPTDISYSLERYNLIRRAYWVNGQREKADTLPCEIEKPLGYITLFSGNVVVGSFVVDGKVTSLNSYLTPDSEYYEGCVSIEKTEYSGEYHVNRWLADVDGSYGANDNGIFFFTPDGKYIEWSGDYLYSDILFSVNNPVLTIGG